MIRDFSKEELEPAASSRDAELTLGGGTLLILGGGLLMLCAVCFGVGYAVGHHSSPEQTASAVMPGSSTKSATVRTSAAVKPGAGGQAAAQAARPAAYPSANSGGGSAQAEQAAAVAGVPSQPQVKPALDSQVRPALGGPTGSGQPARALQIQPALTGTQGWMVQIAAVSHSEDAEVLVNALRKHGYAVTARRDVGDNLIHVQTGPFVNRNDANAMRQKLLNDGYNAIVQ